MKSYEQIARAMYEEFFKDNLSDFPWEELGDDEKQSWVDAAKVAHKEISEVH